MIQAVHPPMRLAVTGTVPRRLRTFREFAEQEIVLPDGPYQGSPYRVSTMPFAGAILDEFDAGRYSSYFGSGPAQGGKTLHFTILPTLYHLFEIEENVIFGAPVVDMAKAAYSDRILPAIECSPRYRDLLPEKGGGSRGGVANVIRFKNGVTLRFLGAGGGDQQVSGYTARVVVATELDKMDEPGKVSREADPVTKLRARTQGFGGRARFYGECTMSTKDGRIYREVCEFGTDSRVFLPCRYCGSWVFPERSNLVGWQEADNEAAAGRLARFQCPRKECGSLWTDEDRGVAIASPRVVARGQSVAADGTVEGPMPETRTWGFRWNAMASPLLKLTDIGEREWRALRAGSDAAEKGVRQFLWAEPWEESSEDLIRPDEAMILSKISPDTNLVRGVVPAGTLKLTLGVDVGLTWIWWVLVAWLSDLRGHVVDFFGIKVPQETDEDRTILRVFEILERFRDETVAHGWKFGDVQRQPDRILVDSGYKHEMVYEFIRKSGQPRWLACKGFGTDVRHGQWRQYGEMDSTERRGVHEEFRYVKQPGGITLLELHADHWKGLVHDGFWAAHGAPGSLTLFHGEADAKMKQFAAHIKAEQRTYLDRPGKERRLVWVVNSTRNHYLDCMTYARCAAAIEGVRLVMPAPTKPAVARPPAAELSRVIRTRY